MWFESTVRYFAGPEVNTDAPGAPGMDKVLEDWRHAGELAWWRERSYKPSTKGPIPLPGTGARTNGTRRSRTVFQGRGGTSDCGGIGRPASLRCWCVKACRFESGQSHEASLGSQGSVPGIAFRERGIADRVNVLRGHAWVAQGQEATVSEAVQ